jgi:hypothetical protein
MFLRLILTFKFGKYHRPTGNLMTHLTFTFEHLKNQANIFALSNFSLQPVNPKE